MDRVRPLGALGYGIAGTDGKSAKINPINVENMQRSRQVGSTPPAYPNGWYCILESRQLKPGQTRSVVIFGRQLLVFRSLDNISHVTSPYCPHLGVNLGVGGRALGSGCVQCPFHGWVFNANEGGKCVNVPYSSRAPPLARLTVWPSVEINRHVYVWYHSDQLPPQWELPVVSEIESGKWQYGGRLEHQVNCHAQEIPENGSDIAHLHHLHLQSIAYGNNPEKIQSENPNPWFKHLWEASWQASTSDRHEATMYIHHKLLLGQTALPGATLNLVARQLGPGVVYMLFDFGALGKCATLHHVTPERPLLQRTRYQLWAPKYWPQPLCNMFLLGEAIQYERDIYMWNNKSYMRTPTLCAEDSAITKHRRWYRQFYSESSKTFVSSSSDPFGSLIDHCDEQSQEFERVNGKLQW